MNRFLALLVAFFSVYEAVASDHTWRQACLAESANNFKPYSPSDVSRSSDNESGISHDRAEIDRLNILYPLDVYVGYTSEGTQFTYCMRFEIHNAGNSDVDGVRWPFAGLSFGLLSAQGKQRDKRSLTGNYHSNPYPDPYPSDIVAFANTPDEIISYMPRAASFTKPQQTPTGSRSSLQYRFKPSDLEAAIAKAVGDVAAVQPERTVNIFKGLALTDASFEPEEIVRVLSLGDGTILKTSTRVSGTDGNQIRITNSVQVASDTAGKEMRINAPYLMALLKLGGGDDVNSVSEGYKDVVAYSASWEDSWITVKSSVESALGTSQSYQLLTDQVNILPIIAHPVAIATGDGVDCMLVPAYAPAPIRFSLDDCPN
ncbi:hypothetical protein [Hoeflea sp. TYP-13]|uniref:hypothetical protein n=1 Tax=Hoeflea sp. TYP-13 TaxID=3230023 RepID=UPI0034C609BB